MNRIEFMQELERLLSDISAAEREEALQYYNDYLNDAGVENEEEVIASWGTPAKVAATIKAGLLGGEEGAFTENGYQDYEEEPKNSVTEWKKYDESEKHEDEGQKASQQTVQNPPAVKRKRTTAEWIAIILICLILSPVILTFGFGFLVTLFGILVAVLAVIFSVVVTVAAVAFSLLVTGIVLIGVGFAKMFASPLGGTLLLAVGALATGVALLFVALTVWVVGKAVPAVIRFIVSIFTRLFQGRREKTA